LLAKKIAIPPAYKLNLEAQKEFFDDIVRLESHIKYDFINAFLRDHYKKFADEVHNYHKELVAFQEKEKVKINLERARYHHSNLPLI
jgi:hypothetical protein